jgi:DNA polymerase-3 subunit epsilon
MPDLPLKLERPLIVLDIESTGDNPRIDRIIDLAMIKIFPDGREEVFSFRFNPCYPISEEARSIHHITEEDIKNAPAFHDKAQELLTIIQNCDFAGFNAIRFDVPMLLEEFARAGIQLNESSFKILDAQRIFHRKEPRTLSAALQFYCNTEHVDAHGALADAEATLKVLEAQFKKYQDIPHNLEALNQFCSIKRKANWADKSGKLKWENGEVVINFGKEHYGKRLKDLVEKKSSILKWILKSDFPNDTKEIVANAILGKYPPPPEHPETDS